MKKVIVLLTIVFACLSFTKKTAVAKETAKIDFFYSVTCPHCIKEQAFLDAIGKKYPQIKINRFEAAKNSSLLEQFYKKYQVPLLYRGAVPITFIKDKYFLGFNEEIGNNIKNFISGNQKKEPSLIEKLTAKKYSLPVIAIILGTLDGFNVCSLGALLIILTLVLSLRSRKKIFLFGGTYLFTTAFIYGLLIFFWYQLFNLITPYIRKMEIIIGLLTLLGGIYFIKEFIKAYKNGPNCEIDEGKKLTGKFSVKFKKLIEENTKLLPIVLSILLFSLTITIVEFPCSAAVPLTFASILAKAQLSNIFYLIYITLFVIFYLLDEIIIFLIAVFSMKLWLSSPKFVTWIILLQAIIMLLLSFHYLVGLF